MAECMQELTAVSERMNGDTPTIYNRIDTYNAIVGYRNSIAELLNKSNKTRECPFCKEIIKSGAVKCRYCGSELLPKSEQPEIEPLEMLDYDSSIIYCSACCNENIMGDINCFYCGEKIDYFQFEDDIHHT